LASARVSSGAGIVSLMGGTEEVFLTFFLASGPSRRLRRSVTLLGSLKNCSFESSKLLRASTSMLPTPLKLSSPLPTLLAHSLSLSVTPEVRRLRPMSGEELSCLSGGPVAVLWQSVITGPGGGVGGAGMVSGDDREGGPEDAWSKEDGLEFDDWVNGGAEGDALSVWC